jgi:hypothetical protein
VNDSKDNVLEDNIELSIGEAFEGVIEFGSDGEG